MVVGLRAEPDGRTGRRVAPDRPAVLLASPGPPGEPGGPDACAGQTGLEPATCGFGDRCATNCATALRRPGLHDNPRDTDGHHPEGVRAATGAPPGHGSSWRTSTAGGPLYATSAAWVEPPGARPAAPAGPRGTCHLPISPGTARRDLCHYGPRERADASPRPRVSARLAAIAESATLAVDAKAKALKAAGRPVIGFGAGEPDFPTPGYIVDAAVAAAKDPVEPPVHPGRRACRRCARRSPPRRCATPATRSKPSQVLVTNGGKQAVYQAFAAIVDPGDEVLLPAPYWTTYPEAIRLAGGVPVEVFAGVDQGYLVTVEQLEAARTPRTKVLLFCSPSNPTGAVYSPEQTARDRRAGRSSTASGSSPTRSTSTSPTTTRCSRPSCARCRSWRTRRSSLNGVAKTYAMTGWRVGWMIGPADVDHGRHEPAVAPHVERRERVAAGGDRRAHRRPRGGRGDADRVRPPAAHDRRDADRRSTASDARRPRARSTSTRPSRACSAARSAA